MFQQAKHVHFKQRNALSDAKMHTIKGVKKENLTSSVVKDELETTKIKAHLKNISISYI